MSKLDDALKPLPDEEAEYIKPLIKDLMLELIGKESGSDMNDDELVHAIRKMYQWGISTGRKLEAGVIDSVDDREWEMIASRLDQFEQTFTNRQKRELRQKVEEL